MEDIVYTYCGHAYGQFTSDRTGEVINYCNLYVIWPITGPITDDRSYQGYQADKISCVSPDILEGLEPEDKIYLLFNRRGRVVGVKPVKAK